MIASLSLRRILVSRGDVRTAYVSAWRHMANPDLGNARYRTRATCPVGCARENFLHASNTVPHGVPGEGNHHDVPNHMASKDRKATVRADIDTAVYPPKVGYMHGLWLNRPRRPRREKGPAILRKVTQHVHMWKEADAIASVSIRDTCTVPQLHHYRRDAPVRNVLSEDRQKENANWQHTDTLSRNLAIWSLTGPPPVKSHGSRQINSSPFPPPSTSLSGVSEGKSRVKTQIESFQKIKRIGWMVRSKT